MTKAALKRQLAALLAGCPDTAFFLEGVEAVVEDLYADDDEGCPAGFEALDAAVQAFDAAENEEEDGEDDDEEDDEEA